MTTLESARARSRACAAIIAPAAFPAALLVAALLVAAATPAFAQTRDIRDLTPIPANTNPQAAEPAIVGSSDMLALTDSSGKTIVLRNRQGDLIVGPPTSSGISDMSQQAQYATTIGQQLVVKEDGSVAIGTHQPEHRLSVRGGPMWTSAGWRGAVDLENAAAIGWQRNAAGQGFGMGHTNGGFYIFRTTSNLGTATTPARYDLAITDEGVVSVNVLEIKGADMAEAFEVVSRDAAGAAAQPGMVVSINPERPGGLVISDRAYDPRVAGVISGAGGLGPGVLLGRDMGGESPHPVALSGRVYCWVDDSGGRIEPGDLLTTSATPGFAMKLADPTRASGAVLGKAMTGLEGKSGMILVLVTLQ